MIVQWSVESGRGHFVVGTEPFELGTVGAVYITAKQVGQLAPGYWTAPFIAAPFLIFSYAHLQISFRLDDYLVLYSLVLFCASFSLVCLFVFFHPRPNGCNINTGSFFFFFNSITHCTPVRKLVRGGLTKMEIEF